MLQVSSNSNIIHLDILFKTMNAITRKSNAVYGLGGGVTQDDEVLKGANCQLSEMWFDVYDTMCNKAMGP